MLGLAELLDAPARGYALRVDELLEGSELSTEDREVFAKAVRDPGVSATKLESSLAKLVPPVKCSRTAIVNWRRDHNVAS